MKNSNKQIGRLHEYVTNKSTPTSELFERKADDISKYDCFLKAWSVDTNRKFN